MDLRQLNTAIFKTAQAVLSNEKFFTGALVSKARQLTEEFPYDTTVVGMYNFLKKKADHDPMISRKDLYKTYELLYSNNNKFAEYFAEELGINTTESETTVPVEQKDLLEEVRANLDPTLVNNFAACFDKSIKYASYSLKLASQCEQLCAHLLNRMSIPPKTVEVTAGNQEVLICRANYESPKGEVTVLVPVFIQNEEPLIPDSFVGTEGLINLNANNLKDFIVKSAGKILKVNADTLVQHLSKQATPLDDVELAILKMKLGSNTLEESLAGMGIMFQDPNEFFKSASEVEVPQYELPEELKGFGERLSTVKGEAELRFGNSTVEASRKLLTNSLASFGYKNPKLGIASVSDNCINFSVALDNYAGFKVPITIKNNKPQNPTYAIANGNLQEFSALGICELLKENDYKAALISSPYYELTTEEVLNNLVVALEENNLLKAEDALHVLRETDEQAFRAGNEMYLQALQGEFGLRKSASVSKCAAPIQSPNSKYLVCSHTGLPINKVYQDQFGDCRPLHRKGHEDGTENALLSTYKIFWG